MCSQFFRRQKIVKTMLDRGDPIPEEWYERWDPFYKVGSWLGHAQTRLGSFTRDALLWARREALINVLRSQKKASA